MPKAILFDLDDTLLGDVSSRFFPAYLRLLQTHFQADPAASRVVQAIVPAILQLFAQPFAPQTVEQALWADLAHRSAEDVAQIAPKFHHFYGHIYPQLEAHVTPLPFVRPLLQRLTAEGYRLAIATNPVFPRSAVEQRLAWAGVAVEAFPDLLVTTYERMHAVKPNPDYYREVAELLGVDSADCLMVGNDWENDIVPAQAVGMATFWVTPTTPLSAEFDPTRN